MSLITIEPVYDGAFVSTETINDNFRKFTEINGSLGALNVQAIDKAIDHRHIQLEAMSGGTMVGGTANLDYFNGVRYGLKRTRPVDLGTLTMQHYDHGYLVFYGLDTTGIDSTFRGVGDAVTANAKRTVAIPGASTSFFLPYDAHVLVTWQVSWTSDAARFGIPGEGTPVFGTQENKPEKARFTTPNTAIRFFFDDEEHNQASTTRETREAMFASSLPNPEEAAPTERMPKHALRDRYKSRYWSGHAYIGTKSKGFHTTSLRVCSQAVVRQTRVRVRNIKVLYFKA